MPLTINECVSEEQHFENIDKLYGKCLVKFKGNDELLGYVSELREFAKEMVSFAPEYQFDGIQANGYWSLYKMGVKLIELGVEKYDFRGNVLSLKRFTVYVRSFRNGYKYLQILRSDTLQQQKGSGGQMIDLESPHMDRVVDCFHDYLNLEDEIDAFNAMSGFYGDSITPFSCIVLQTYVIALGVKSFGQLFRAIGSYKYRCDVLKQMVKKLSVPFLEDMLGFSESLVNRIAIPIMLHGVFPTVKDTVYIKRQIKWNIYYDAVNRKASVEKDHTSRTTGDVGPVRCRLLYQPEEGQKPRGSLLFHCHGGGFVGGSPDSNESYLRGWATDIPGVPILSVDYSLSPKARFPVALQEILDVYLWVSSGTPEVKEMLGFYPSTIVFCGDSCGGLLLMSILVILNEINKHFGQQLKKPTAFVGIYSSFTLSVHMSPGILMCPVHIYLLPAVLLSLAEAYIPPDLADEKAIEPKTELGILSRVWSKLKDMKDNALWFLPHERIEEGSVWFLKGRDAIHSRLAKDSKIIDSPFMSPLKYTDFESLSDVSLYLIALHSDPIIDHSVMMARKWKGPVNLNVLDNVSHSFLNLNHLNPTLGEANDLCVQKVRDALGYNIKKV